MEKPSLVDLAIAPLTLLERSKGWKRHALLLLYLLVVTTLAVIGSREMKIWGLPDPGEPFDLIKYGTVEVADADNAMVLYREALKKLIPPIASNYHVSSGKAWNHPDWSNADPEIRRWVADNREALSIWLRGTERPECLSGQPRDYDQVQFLAPVHELREFSKIAIWEASRLEQSGDVEGAWSMYRAVLRTSRHVGMHAGAMRRFLGQGILDSARPPIESWVESPQVTPGLLKRAIADLETCRSMTPPVSDMIRTEYFAWNAVLDRPETWRRYSSLEGPERWLNQFSFVPPLRYFLAHEPERSHRIHRLIAAGQLAQADRPRASRPRLASTKYLIYEVDSRTPAALASLTPEALASWADRSVYSSIVGDFTFSMTRIDLESTVFDSLQLRMAERAFLMEHGQKPKLYGDLIGPYLKTLPDGIEPDFPIVVSQSPD